MKSLSLRGRLLAAVVGLGLALGLASAGGAVYLDYRHHATETGRQLERAGNSSAPAFSRAVWTVDASQIELLLDSLARLPMVDYVAVVQREGEVRAHGQMPDEILHLREFPLTHTSETDTFVLGHLVLAASRAPLRAALWQRIGWIVAENLARNLLLAGALMVLFNHLVTRRLTALAASLERDPLALEDPAATPRRASASRADEIQQLAGAIAHMRIQVAEAHRQLQAERDRYSAAILENPDPIWQLQFHPPLPLTPAPTAAALAGAARLTEVNAAAQRYVRGPVQGAWQVLDLLPEDLFEQLADGGSLRTDLSVELPARDQVFRHNLTLINENGLLTAIWGISTDITTATRALAALAASEAELRESRARFLDAQRMAQLGHWTFDTRTQKFSPSAEMLRIYGFPKDTVPTPDELDARIDPADFDRIRPILMDPSTTAVHVSFNINPAPGEVRTLDLIMRKTLMDGQVVEFFGIVRDVTEERRNELAREQTQRVLMENERRMAKAQAIAQMGYWVVDLETMEFSGSDELFRLFGHEPGSVAQPGQMFNQQVHPEDRHVVEALRQSLIDRPQSFEYRIIRPDGSVRHMLGSTTPELDAEGRAQKVFGIALDITERKRAEAEFRASQELVTCAFEASPDGIFIADLGSGQLLMANSACEAMTGGRAGTPLAELPLRSASEADTESPCARICDEPQATNLAVQITRGDAPAEALLTWRSVTVNGGQTRLGMLRDISAFRELERLNQRQRDQLAQADKLAALGTMVAGVAHEINNPNYLIALNADLLSSFTAELLELVQESGDDDPPLMVSGLEFPELKETLPELLHDITTSSRRIDKIVRDLKEFARPQGDIAREAVRINPLLQHTLKQLPPLPTEPRLHLQLCETEPMVDGDAAQLGQILLNLITNAAETGSEDVWVRTEATDELVTIEVADRGPGVAPEIRGQLFDPFFTTKRSSGGTGLGLSISHRLAREHGGSLEFLDNPGGGSIFRLSLPPWRPQNAIRPATKFAPAT